MSDDARFGSATSEGRLDLRTNEGRIDSAAPRSTSVPDDQATPLSDDQAPTPPDGLAPTLSERAKRVEEATRALTAGRNVAAVGVDIEDVERWRDPRRTLAKIFTPDELAYAARKADPAPTYAGLWCAREAAWKALAAHSPLGQRQLAVAHGDDGAPRIVALNPRDADLVARLRLSISHTKTTAIAVAILTR